MIKAEAIKSNNTTKILLIICAALLLAYASLAFNAMKAQYTMDELSERINSLEEESSDLRLELSRASSLDNVLERSDSLSYTEIERVSYIEKPSTSPFAAR